MVSAPLSSSCLVFLPQFPLVVSHKLQAKINPFLLSCLQSFKKLLSNSFCVCVYVCLGMSHTHALSLAGTLGP